MTTQQSLPITRPTVTPREEAYGARVQTYEQRKDVTDEFQVLALDIRAVPDHVLLRILHKPCAVISWVDYEIDEVFYCRFCNRKFQIASVIPLKIVEVPTVEY
jgi:uncharacterized protein YbaR (Trm112 family)